MKKRLLAFAAAALCGLLLFAGCSGGDSMKKKIPGSLYGVTYSFRHGSMYGEDFYIDLAQDQVICASYFDWELRDDGLVEVFGAPVSAEVWAEVEALVLELYPMLTPVREPGFWDKVKEFLPFFEMPIALDQDSESLSFIWKTESGLETVRYIRCFDEKELSLLELLEKIARACPVPEEE